MQHKSIKVNENQTSHDDQAMEAPLRGRNITPKPYRFEDEEEVRDGFWQEFPELEPRGSGRQNEQPTDTRVAFCDWIDQLARAGAISEDLAQEVTL